MEGSLGLDGGILWCGACVMTDPMFPLPAGVEHGKNVSVCNSTKSLKDQIIHCLNEEKKRRRIARAEHELVLAKHRSWHVMERMMLDVE